jgi:NADH-quinone oxidoreductase subunit M
MDFILSILIFFPLVAAILATGVDKRHVLSFGIAATAIEFVLSLGLWIFFDMSADGLQFVEFTPIIQAFGVSYYVGIDGISLFLIILSTFMTMIALIGLSETRNIKNLVISILILEMTMIGVFVSLDVILFYLFWEFSLVPMLYIIGAWGGERRLYASIKFFLYTFAGSIIMLIGILYFAKLHHDATGVWSFALTHWYMLDTLGLNVQFWLFLAFFLGFAIKVPMFPFHTWLPYAHGQAPTIGSVILAAILLKMGTYGFVRFSLPLFPDVVIDFITPIAILSIIMVIYTALIAFAQKDMKQVIAYSSISHMGIIVLGIFALNPQGITGSIFLMLSHGIVSGALFMLVGVIYERRHTKLINQFGGLAKVMPNYAVIFGIMLMGSVGLPLTIGFIGEFLSLMGFFKVSPVLAALAGVGIIVGAVYMLNLFREAFFGEVAKEENKTLKDLNKKELKALIPLTALVIILGVYPKPILDPIDKSVQNLLFFMEKKAKLDKSKQFYKNINNQGVKE